MRNNMKKLIRKILNKLGYDIKRFKKNDYPIDISKEIKDLYEEIEPYTVTTIESVAALVKSVEYIINNKLEGDFVECGVWKGGSCMIMARELLKKSDYTRQIWMYDTFEGMSQPTDDDEEIETGIKGIDLLSGIHKTNAKYNMWAYSPIDEVKDNMQKTGYPSDKINYVKGKVEDTLSKSLPAKIALLRLDTDWYESTKIELEMLYPLVTKGGIIIIDDYGHFSGAKKAVDEYFNALEHSPFMNRIDYSGRLIIKK